MDVQLDELAIRSKPARSTSRVEHRAGDYNQRLSFTVEERGARFLGPSFFSHHFNPHATKPTQRIRLFTATLFDAVLLRPLASRTVKVASVLPPCSHRRVSYSRSSKLTERCHHQSPMHSWGIPELGLDVEASKLQ